MRVLIAVDGSAGSFEAVEQVGSVLAERDEPALYYTPPAVRLRSGATDPKVLAEAQEALAQVVFDEAKKRLPPALQAKVHTIAGLQDVRQGILVEADAWSAELIALGARGLTTLRRLLLGSVSRTIVHRSTRPVWVARAPSPGHRSGMNVLIPYESAETCRPSAELLSKFTWPHGTTFTSISVVPSIFAGRLPEWLEQQAHSPEVEAMVKAWAREHDEELAARQKGMEEFFRGLPAPLANCRPLVAEGEPAREILSAIHKEQINLAVVGTARLRSVASMILGSTADAVLNHAECSVLVVPH